MRGCARGTTNIQRLYTHVWPRQQRRRSTHGVNHPCAPTQHSSSVTQQTLESESDCSQSRCTVNACAGTDVLATAREALSHVNDTHDYFRVDLTLAACESNVCLAIHT